mmetsp:Transcript_20237/g.26099  ORF Transcript_20237/g.26099 Transcript_20237/m.26099 type:complete len:98 (-) Transcript_20237:1612-1905(-)
MQGSRNEFSAVVNVARFAKTVANKMETIVVGSKDPAQHRKNDILRHQNGMRLIGRSSPLFTEMVWMKRALIGCGPTTKCGLGGNANIPRMDRICFEI